MSNVFIVVWEDDSDGLNAQAYATREAAVRDFPEFDERDVPDYEKRIIESSVQA